MSHKNGIFTTKNFSVLLSRKDAQMKIVAAMDSFRDSLSAIRACEIVDEYGSPM